MVSKNPYLELAEKAIEMDIIYSAMCNPKPEYVFFIWRGEFYKGSIQRLFSKKPEIALTSRSINPFEEELVETIRSLDKDNERPGMKIPDDIELKGVYAVLHIKGENVCLPTDEEMEYFHKNKPKMVDVKLF